MATAAPDNQFKKQKTSHDNKSKNYYNQKSRRNFLEAGQRGFLATCNFREKDCVRECYNLLNEYADKLYGSSIAKTEPKKSPDSGEAEAEDIDISDALQKELDDAQKKTRRENRRFNQTDTGTSNCIFIKTTLPDPVELGIKIVKDIAETKLQKSRFLLRLIPVDIVCKANPKDIMNAAGPFLDKHFLNSEKTFSVIFNKRYNNDVSRTDVINELAKMVADKGPKNKVDLKNAEISIVVEVIKGLACLSVLPNYMKWKKYNLVELVSATETPVEGGTEAIKKTDELTLDDQQTEVNEMEAIPDEDVPK